MDVIDDTWVEKRVLRSTRAAPIQLTRLMRGQPELRLVNIARSVYLDVSDIPADAKPWIVRKVVALARMFALQMLVGSAQTPLLFTAECAGVALGVPTWWNNPDIAYRADVPRRRKRQLPAVQIGSVRVAAVTAFHVTGGVDPEWNHAMRTRGGLFLAAPVVMVADSSRREHTQQAFVLACSLLTWLTDFDWRNPAKGRQKANRIRSEWMRKAQEIKGERSYRVFAQVVAHMQTGIDSPLEAAALWAIKCLLTERSRGTVFNQVCVETRNGRRYFLDLAFPGLKVGIEIDGRGKYGRSAVEVEAYAAQYTNRHQEISDEGWQVRHLTSKEVSSPNLLVIMGRNLQDLGVLPRNRVPWPRGPLHQAAVAELHSRARRF